MNKKTTIQVLQRLRKNWFNKYLLTFIVFAIWVLFFDKYNVIAQFNLKHSTEKLELEYQTIREDIVIAKRESEELELNHEKYGREKYFLHKGNEDVFIIDKK